MAGIDLPYVPAVAGEIIAGFGEQISNVASGLTKMYTAQQQALLDARTAGEVIQAQSLAMASINEFNKVLDDSPDYAQYGDMWDAHKSALHDQLSEILTLPESQQTFDAWWTGEQDKQADYVYGKTREKTVASTQANATIAIDEYKRIGDEQKLYDLGKYLVAQGIYTKGEVSSMLEKAIPQAHYNKVIRDFANMDPTKAAAQLASGGNDFGLDSQQLSSAVSHFQSLAENQKKLADSISEEDGKKYYDEYLQKRSSPDGFQSLEDMMQYGILVDKTHREMVRQDIEAYKKDLPHAVEFSQDAHAVTIQSQIWDWAANAPADSKAPIDETTVTRLLQPNGDQPATLRDAGAAAIRKALSEAAVVRDDKEVSAMYSRMYNAVDSGKNPALELTIKEIDATIQDAGKHQAVLAKRQELQNQYESGSNATKESVLLEGYSVVYNPNMSVEAKQKWIDNAVKLGGGLKAEDGQKLRSWIDGYNENPARKTAMDAITSAYRLSMANPVVTTQGKKDLELELYNARNEMEKLFIDPKTTKADIEAATESFLSARATTDLRELIKQVSGAYVDRFATGEARPKYREATVYEYLREQGQLRGEIAAQFAQDIRPRAEQLEKDALNKAGIRATFMQRLTSGDLVYSTKALVKGTTGKLLMSDTGGQGTLYQVRYQVQNGEYIPTVYKQNPQTGAFDVIAWEWK